LGATKTEAVACDSDSDQAISGATDGVAEADAPTCDFDSDPFGSGDTDCPAETLADESDSEPFGSGDTDCPAGGLAAGPGMWSTKSFSSVVISVLSTMSSGGRPPEQRTREQVDRLVLSVVDRRETTTTRYDGCRESSIRCHAYLNVEMRAR
jgi:hypothetical protein